MNTAISWMPFLAFAVRVAVLPLPAAGAAEDAPAPAEGETMKVKCTQCKAGKVECPDCRGSKQAKKPCNGTKCAGGKVPCTSCRGTGNTKCRKCGGDGYTLVEDGVVVEHHVQRKKYKKVPCPTTETCRSCSGSGQANCSKCKGTGEMTAACPTCKGTGKTKCPNPDCKGGWVEIVAPPPAKEPAPPHPAEAIVADLRRSMKFIREAGDRWKDARFADLSADRKKISVSIDEMVKLADRFPADRPEFADLRDSAKSFPARWKTLADSIDADAAGRGKLVELRGKVDKVLSGAEDVAAMAEKAIGDGRLMDATEMDTLQDEVKRAHAFLDDFDKAAQDARSVDRETALTDFGRDVDDSLRQVKAKYAEVKDEYERKVKISGAFAAARPAMDDFAKKDKLAKAAIGLAEDRSEPDALVVEVSFLDEEAKDHEALADVTPSRGTLEKVARWVQQVFVGYPAVKTIAMTLQVDHVDDTGHTRPSPCQKFSFDQARWEKLMTGKFGLDEDGETVKNLDKVLAGCAPSPPYPRSSFWDGTTIMILLMCGFFVALVIFVFARNQLLKSM